MDVVNELNKLKEASILSAIEGDELGENSTNREAGASVSGKAMGRPRKGGGLGAGLDEFDDEEDYDVINEMPEEEGEDE